MKVKDILLTSLTSATLFGLVACSGDNHDDHDHADHDHDEHAEDHDDHDHDHGEAKVAGPNGGRILLNVEPHIEFFVTADNKVQLSALDDANKAAPIGEQSAKIIAGDRSNPTTLTFAKQGEALLSNESLPEGDDYPMIVMITANAAATPVTEKFTLDLTQCPTCDYKEYACTCDH